MGEEKQIRDIRFWLRTYAEKDREGFLWLVIEETLGLRLGVNDKFRIIRECETIDFPQDEDLWKYVREVIYRYDFEDTEELKYAKKADDGVHKRHARDAKYVLG
jgi:hypothetical protein